MAKKYDFEKNSFEEKFNEIYFDSLERVKESKEYIENSKQIDLYKKILKNNYHVDSNTIEKFISLIQEKLELEYESGIKNTINYIDNNNNNKN